MEFISIILKVINYNIIKTVKLFFATPTIMHCSVLHQLKMSLLCSWLCLCLLQLLLPMATNIYPMGVSAVAECSHLPTTSELADFLQSLVDNAGDEGGQTIGNQSAPHYTCLLQGRKIGTSKQASIIMTYTVPSSTDLRTRQFEMDCIGDTMWVARLGSLSTPTVANYLELDFWRNCSTCGQNCSSCGVESNDNHCFPCDSTCNIGLMRCTGELSSDCCVAFEDDGVCSPDLNCNKDNFVANEQNNYTCACGLVCADGYALDTTLCSCILTDICLADSPCDNGVCVLGSSPDQYTCNCTGTNYIGTNCSECNLICTDQGFRANPLCTECIVESVCLAFQPCQNGGSCVLDPAPNHFSCVCTNSYDPGSNCSECSLICDPGYIPDIECFKCILNDACEAFVPCQNGGTCILDLAPDQFSCLCLESHDPNLNCSGQISMKSSSEAELTPAVAAGVAVAAFALTAVLLIVTAVVLGLCVIHNKKKRYKRTSASKLKPKEEYFSHKVDKDENDYNLQFELSKVNKRTSVPGTSLIDPLNLKVLETIGQGEFGIVYRGVLTKHSKNDTILIPVAVKTLKGTYSHSQVKLITEEAQKMSEFDHTNVLPLIGVCIGLPMKQQDMTPWLEGGTEEGAPCIVMPFMSNGSLLSFLRKEAANLTVSELADENIVSHAIKQLLSMCLQVAKGMEYLTEQKFVHRDLAARNCMMSSDGVLKVADFGLAEDVYVTEYFKQVKDSNEVVKLPIKWMALESIHLGKFSEKTDIWSYGVLCWEVFSSGKNPYPGLDPRGVVRMLDAGERLDKPKNVACTKDIYSLMMSCWEESADKRPRFTTIVTTLEDMIAPMANYIELNTQTTQHNCS